MSPKSSAPQAASLVSQVLMSDTLTLINVLDYAANALKMHRTDVIRRSLIRDVNSLLRDEVLRAQSVPEREDW